MGANPSDADALEQARTKEYPSSSPWPFEDLAALYRLWANVDGRRVGCVSFVPTEQGHVGMLIPPMPTSLATSVSVSVETDPVGAVPQGPMVLSSRI
jgi:hypothetical protein